MRLGTSATLVLLATALAGCAEPTDGQKIGTVTGAGLGAGIGRAAAIGTRYPWVFAGSGLVAGAAVGNAIGEYMDPPPSRMWAAATIEAAETARPGEPVPWSLRDHRGQVTMIGAAWTDSGGRDCRTLRQQTGGDDGTPPAFVRDVVACRGGDGTWEVVTPSADEK
ncbi:PHB depolymerase family esterase [Magnetospirillum molischianum]|uniref:Surface antigen n=1 Tax=Magnetospirillum molischianum DSM 120 TaxID=1150626 RepID=H8FW46_MAGML|nr:PHB depolymerase family esterase [Magnetospirillum molischianum]CCG42584.1 Surface antigen [Magnetospirillum molischianum DSM 120]